MFPLTGDPVFDNALRRDLEVQLQQSPHLNLLSGDPNPSHFTPDGQPPGTQVTGQVAQEVCVRTGTAAMLEGSILERWSPVPTQLGVAELPDLVGHHMLA